MEQQQRRVYHIRVDSDGGIILPSEVCQRHQLKPGDTVAFIETDRGVEIKSMDQVIKDARESTGEERRALCVGDFSEEDLAAIEKSQMPAEYDYLNDEIETS